MINIRYRCELFLSIFPPMDLSPEREGLVYLAGFNLGNKSDEQAGKYQNKDHFSEVPVPTRATLILSIFRYGYFRQEPLAFVGD